MNEQSCGTCDYFTQNSNDISGTCWWATKNPVPIVYIDNIVFTGNITLTYRTWGEDCPCWVEKYERTIMWNM